MRVRNLQTPQPSIQPDEAILINAAKARRFRRHESGYIYGRPFSEANISFGILEVGLDFEEARVDCVGRAFLAKCVKEVAMDEKNLQFKVEVGRCSLHFAKMKDCE